MSFDATRPQSLSDAAYEAHHKAQSLKLHLEELQFPVSASVLVTLRAQRVMSALGSAKGVDACTLPDLSAFSNDLEAEIIQQTSSLFVYDECHIDGGMMLSCRSDKGEELALCHELVLRLIAAIIALDAMQKAQDHL